MRMFIFSVSDFIKLFIQHFNHMEFIEYYLCFWELFSCSSSEGYWHIHTYELYIFWRTFFLDVSFFERRKCFFIFSISYILYLPFYSNLAPFLKSMYMCISFDCWVIFTISRGSFTLSICSKNFGSSFLIRDHLVIFDFVL